MEMRKKQNTSGPRWPGVLLLICAFEIFYLLLVALAPLPLLQLNATPLAAALPWVLIPYHLLQPLFGVAATVSSSEAWVPLLILGLTLLALMIVYGLAIVDALNLSKRYSVTSSTRWLLLLLGGALLFGLTLLLLPKLFSDDVFTYIFSGRILTVYGADPLNTAPSQFPSDPYLAWIRAGRSSPNIYGALWLCVTSFLVGLDANPTFTLLLFKGGILLTHLINILLIWGILSKIAPARQLLGTLTYAWNPLVLVELAGNGQSEGLLLTLLLLAMWLYVHGKGYWHTLATLLVLGLAVSFNLITLLLAPLLIWFDVRTEQSILRALWGFSWRFLIMCVPALAISLPFWRGASTFFALTSAIDMQHFVHSPIGTLSAPAHAAFRWAASFLHLATFLQPDVAADMTLRASATFIFVLIYVALYARVRHAPTANAANTPRSDPELLFPGLDSLLDSFVITVFCYLGLVSGWFWPWYILWMLWIVALRRFDALTATVLLLSGTALFLYPFVTFADTPYEPALIFGIPLVYLIIVKWRERFCERTSLTYERGSQTTQD